MSKTFQRPDKSFFQNPTELGHLINKGNFIQKYLPKQTDIDKMLEVIQRKVLKALIFLWKLKFKWDICIVHILKIYICICYKTNSHLQNQQLESWKHQQKSMSYWTHYCSEYHQKKREWFWQFQKCMQTKL